MAFSFKRSLPTLSAKPRNPAIRRIRSAVAGASLVLLSGFLFLVINTASSQRVEALAINDGVAKGTPIGEDNLRVIKVVKTPGAHYVSARKKGDVIGSTATVALSDGTVLSADLFDRNGANQGTMTVAALVRPGFAPALIVGDQVTIVGTTTPQASVFGSSRNDLGKRATTIGIGTVRAVNTAGSSSGDTIVSLEVDPKIAADVAAASSAGGLALLAVNTLSAPATTTSTSTTLNLSMELK